LPWSGWQGIPQAITLNSNEYLRYLICQFGPS
jgi:hypothetical protein